MVALIARAAPVAATVLVQVAAPLTAQTPVMFRGDPAHTGRAEPLFAGQGGITWRARTGGPVRSMPAVTATRVFVGSGDGYLYALDRATGRVVWRHAAGSAVASSPAVVRGLVIAQSAAGRVVALDVRTGRLRWSARTGDTLPHDFHRGSWDYYVSSPTIVDDAVLIGGGDGVYRFDLTTGRQVWRAATRGRVRATPSVAGQLVVVGAWDARVYAFDLATGAERWVHATVGDTLNSVRWGFDRRAIDGSAAIDGNGVFVGSRDGGLYGLDLADGRRRFRATHRGSWVIGSPAARDGRAIVGSSDGLFVHAVDAVTGEEVWRTRMPDNTLSSPTLAGDAVLIGAFDGQLIALDAASGAVRWRLHLGAPILSTPVVAHGEVYVGTDAGEVVAIRQVLPRPARLAVFWDDAHARNAYMPGARLAKEYFEQLGYEVLGADSLAAFMRAAIQRDLPSVVVFALDWLPPSVAPVRADTVLFRRYLEAGGKVVWLSTALGAIDRDSLGRIVAFVGARQDSLLGMHASAVYGFNQHPAHPTARGRRWGLAPAGHGDSPMDTTLVTHALATDLEGRTASWVWSFARSAPGMGFVKLWGNGVTAERLPLIRAVAEYGLLRPAAR